VHSIVFGSHAPYQYLDAALLKLRESCLSQADMDAIVYGNAQRLFGPQTSEAV
jgi:predicted TIM-barrel fold metal-dependent hydrolase